MDLNLSGFTIILISQIMHKVIQQLVRIKFATRNLMLIGKTQLHGNKINRANILLSKDKSTLQSRTIK